MVLTPASGSGREGINVVGHLSSSAGLGYTARMFIRLLQGRGLRLAGFDLERRDSAATSALTGIDIVGSLRELPFKRTFVIASLHHVPRLWLRFGAAAVDPSHRFFALVFWELPAIPKPWAASLRMFDAILTCSEFVRKAVEAAIPDMPSLHAEHPLDIPALEFDRAEVRSAHGLAADSTVFWCTFDPRSGLLRKNPAAAIQAFLEAFPERSDVSLIVKSNGPASADDLAHSGVPPGARSDRRILWLEHYLPHAELMRLFSSCDVYVSLHRSEGLGLVPMEAMSLGKLVIATGYSGNMTYMTEANSLPVPFRLVEPDDRSHFMTRRFAGEGALWADPDVAAAAGLMRGVLDRPESARRLAATAHADIAARQESAWRADWIDELEGVLPPSTRYRLRRRLRPRVLASQLLNPTLLRRNVELLRHWLDRRRAR